MNTNYFSKTIPMKQVTIKDSFWNSYMELAKNKIIPYQWEALNDRIPEAEPSHCINNFKIAAGIQEGKFGGFVFQDSDLAKWIEAAAFSLVWCQNPTLEQTIDEAIDLVASAQQEDGYLDTYYIINGLEDRWTNLKDNHEMYCAGHMLEAAVAYYHATGKRKLLDCMIRLVDHIDKMFGPEDDKKKGYPGHEVLEMALMKLYAITKEEKHLNLAKYFINQRGQKPLYFELEQEENNLSFYWKDSYFQFQYYQAGLPVREQDEAVGHAVRAVYLYSGMADVARETKDDELLQACQRIWANMVHRRMYITGAIGSSSYGESFTFDYDLPNDTVYGETCASIGLVFFAHRMLQIHPRSEYADVIEKALYNGIISGISLDGTKFFYVNPLEVVPEACEKDQLRRHVKPERQKWFGCACCPPNLARTITSLASYIYTQNDKALYLHLYIGNESMIDLSGVNTKISISTSYPWDENVTIKLSPARAIESTIALRIPGWCRAYTICKNNVEIAVTKDLIQDGYLLLHDRWTEGDAIELHFEMPVQMIRSNPMVRANVGKVAIMRGPIVYCLEQEDNDLHLDWLKLPSNPRFSYHYEKDLLGGIVIVESSGLKLEDQSLKEASLYECYTKDIYTEKHLTWIPYYSWANRNVGEMLVWIKTE
jgi:uncharacterized protein